ncbi:hypothetical protein AB0M02_19215 [Actinoplanes sp. NPDC051861]|uniref:hypothetical protein n=1 Tax=Actinoplanes sp. NPDC051861 TaxID=3155170 RepID=UPI00341BB405
MTDKDQESVAAKARLFDVRAVIGGLFILYGLIVSVVGLLDGQSEIDKAEGVRINLWMGLAMLALGLLMLLWLRLNPPVPPRVAEDDGDALPPDERAA